MVSVLAHATQKFWEVSGAERIWLITGAVGQVAFMMRFIVQWIASERRGQSVIPVAFWYLSLVGSLILLSYAIHRLDPVFVAGFSLNCLIYVRNMWLVYHPRPANVEQKPENRSG